jgi:quercetin dioxygenase-like cupin family protein
MISFFRRAALSLAVAWLLALPAAGAAQAPQGIIQEQVALENESVRVALLTFPPGSASGRHQGLDPEMGIVVEGELTLVTDNGREVMRPGTVRWLPALTPHDARNEGDVAVKLWVVFFKKCD